MHICKVFPFSRLAYTINSVQYNAGCKCLDYYVHLIETIAAWKYVLPMIPILNWTCLVVESMLYLE
jgi:hypothetical protein